MVYRWSPPPLPPWVPPPDVHAGTATCAVHGVLRGFDCRVRNVVEKGSRRHLPHFSKNTISSAESGRFYAIFHNFTKKWWDSVEVLRKITEKCGNDHFFDKLPKSAEMTTFTRFMVMHSDYVGFMRSGRAVCGWLWSGSGPALVWPVLSWPVLSCPGPSCPARPARPARPTRSRHSRPRHSRPRNRSFLTPKSVVSDSEIGQF